MRTVTLAETKAHLSAIVEQVQGGEEVVITRRGRRVARIVPAYELTEEIATTLLDELRTFVMSQPEQRHSSTETVRTLRDENRY
jgi:prevent-host-death family protein